MEKKLDWGKIIWNRIVLFFVPFSLFWQFGGDMELGDAIFWGIVVTLVLLFIRHNANWVFDKIGYGGSPTNLLLIFLVVFFDSVFHMETHNFA